MWSLEDILSDILINKVTRQNSGTHLGSEVYVKINSVYIKVKSFTLCAGGRTFLSRLYRLCRISIDWKLKTLHQIQLKVTICYTRNVWGLTISIVFGVILPKYDTPLSWRVRVNSGIYVVDRFKGVALDHVNCTWTGSRALVIQILRKLMLLSILYIHICEMCVCEIVLFI